MLTKSELEEMLASTEMYRVERTKSTTDKDKFGEAVCAFANDMPDCGKPGYLFIGVDNDGHPCGCYNRGIEMVQEELEANGNGRAEFSFRLVTAFEAKVALAGKELGKSPDAVEKSIQKTVEKTVEKILFAMRGNPSITQQQLVEAIGLSRRGIEWQLNQLKAKGLIRGVGPDKGGHWEVMDVGAE